MIKCGTNLDQYSISFLLHLVDWKNVNDILTFIYIELYFSGFRKDEGLPDLLSSDMKREMERKEWEKEEEEAMSKPVGPVHYADVRHKGKEIISPKNANIES